MSDGGDGGEFDDGGCLRLRGLCLSMFPTRGREVEKGTGLDGCADGVDYAVPVGKDQTPSYLILTSWSLMHCDGVGADRRREKGEGTKKE